jgi:hypothetical protein
VPRGVVEGRGAVAQEQRSAVWRASRGGRMGSGPRRGKRVLGPGQSKMNRAIFYLLNIFSTNSNFKCFKECLPMVENFQIKCGFVWN